MKLVIILFSFIFSQMVFADAFVHVGKTTSFENEMTTNQSSGQDSMIVVGLSGINVDQSSKYYEKVGFFTYYSFGKYAHTTDKENQKNYMYSFGLTFPTYKQTYLKLGMSVAESKLDDEWFRKNGGTIKFGNVFNKKYPVEFSYDSSIEVFSLNIGYRWF